LGIGESDHRVWGSMGLDVMAICDIIVLEKINSKISKILSCLSRKRDLGDRCSAIRQKLRSRGAKQVIKIKIKKARSKTYNRQQVFSSSRPPNC
jgi:hypothetical protein